MIFDLNPAYAREIDRTPQANRTENNRLARLARGGDEQARESLINTNLRFVIKLAREQQRRFQGMGVWLDINDAVQDGSYGLLKAADAFDPDYGAALLTFARRPILWEIARGSGVYSCLSVPLNPSYANKGKDTLEHEARANSGMSLDGPIGDGGSIYDVLPAKMESPDELAINNSRREMVERGMVGLTWVEEFVVRSAYGLGREQEQRHVVADILGLTGERVRQIRHGAEYKIKRAITGDGPWRV